MPPVFAHGRLRLYLLKLLEEAPRHGYEVIRLLEERFHGLYAPSAGTVYPRLAKLEAEGLVTHATEGGRKVYSITEGGRGELAGRQDELTDLEREIRDSLAALAADIREDVSGSARALRIEMREQALHAHGASGGADGRWRKEEAKRARREAQEAQRRAREEERRAREEDRRARQPGPQGWEGHTEAAEEIGRIARETEHQVREQARAGDWQGVVQSGFELARQMGDLDLGGLTGHTTSWPPYVKPDPAGAETPDWAAEPASSGDPARDLERLLDRFRDDVRDAARDHGVSEDQLREVRRHLSTAAAHIGVVLRRPEETEAPRGEGAEEK
ncbi:PadR family transcriptional regulator [Streptomyces armeniacus]|uniref:PadR family transcriptional regulator n=1 Tax=Streptomyces armeniacus TaxID=83291 RepID=A0A345XIL2_9ACTN|nr:PadR family transcriptional regulator [Streptomyces armeniacus]AXK31478.1 PadR family transcriptional regulator [Streptomyces armeniacus]